MPAPLDMIVNHEVLNVVLAHLAVPVQVDGACGCGDDEAIGEHGADHLINELVKHFGFPWKRMYDKDIDGVFPPPWCEDAAKIREKYFGEDNEDMTDEPDSGTTDELATLPDLVSILVRGLQQEFVVNPYEARLEALDAALRLQENVEEYASVETLLEEAQDIYDWLTTDCE